MVLIRLISRKVSHTVDMIFNLTIREPPVTADERTLLSFCDQMKPLQRGHCWSKKHVEKRAEHCA